MSSINGRRGDPDRILFIFPEVFTHVNPNHSRGAARVKIEVKNLRLYADHLNQLKLKPWFSIAPVLDQNLNFRLWRGKLIVINRPDIVFEILIILGRYYPRIPPRAFIEEKITEICDKHIYTRNLWTQFGKKYAMIAHDAFDLDYRTQTQWYPNLSIAHFITREIWDWWIIKQDHILQLWDLKQMNLPLINRLNLNTVEVFSNIFCPFCGFSNLKGVKEYKKDQNHLVCTNCQNIVL